MKELMKRQMKKQFAEARDQAHEKVHKVKLTELIKERKKLTQRKNSNQNYREKKTNTNLLNLY